MEHNPERCKEVFASLSEYLNLELAADECSEIEEHLAGCPPCVDFMESLRKTVALCRTYEPEVMPAALSAATRAELEQAWRKMLAARKAAE